MPYKSPLPPHEIEVEDRYGEKRILRQTRQANGGYQLQRMGQTPTQALANEVGVLIGKRVKALRLERGYSLEQLCVRAGLRGGNNPKNRMWEIENAVRKATSIGTVYALAMALEVPVTELLPTVDEVRDVVAPTTVKQTVVAVR